MDDNEKILRDFIKKESLRVIKESQASFLNEGSSLEETMNEVNGLIDMYEKNLDKSNNAEKSARDKEDFSELKSAKGDQLTNLTKVINAYKKKIELLIAQQIELKSEVEDIISRGSNVFKNTELQEFDNETFEKGWGLQIDTTNSSTKLVKILDVNAYKVMDSNIPNIEVGDLLKLPNLKIGGRGNVSVYRKIGDRHEEVATFEFDNVTNMLKNPQ